MRAPDNKDSAPSGSDTAEEERCAIMRRPRLISLAHVNAPATTCFYPGDPPFELETVATIARHGFHLRYVRQGEHTGTHWGAPGHFTAGEPLADELDVNDLFLPAVKIDVRDRCAADPDY